MAVGAIMAWRVSKKENVQVERPAWRDDSLDEWRKQRDAEAEVIRGERTSQPPDASGAATEEHTEKKRHQRIGG